MRQSGGKTSCSCRSPSRRGEAIGSYQELKAEVERLVGEINGLYGGPAHIPVHYLYRSIPQEELGALYRLADVAFVAPVRDGLNLVAKEYVACRDDGGGVLVLSEFAGALSEMGEALRVNPWDVEGTANTLKRASKWTSANAANACSRYTAASCRTACSDGSTGSWRPC